MNAVTDTMRYFQMFYTVPASWIHWAAMKINLGLADWHPMEIFNTKSKNYKIGVVILNQPFTNKERVLEMWNKASFRATVDGGTMEWDRLLKESDESRVTHPVPDLVTGDFDSVDQSLLQNYRSRGAKVVHTPDQDETDYQKCLQQFGIELRDRDIKVNSVVSLVDTAGRLDHIFSNMNSLFLGPEVLGVPLYQLSGDSLAWMLPTGRHRIHIDDRVFGSWCGIVPVGQPAYVTTTGLKWNLLGARLEFGGLISTSNQFLRKETVTVENDRPVIFMMGVPGVY